MQTKKREKGFFDVFKDNLYFLRIAYTACPERIIWDFSIKLIFMVINNLYSLFFLKIILYAIENNKGFRFVAVFIIATAVLFSIKAFINSWYNHKIKPITDQVMNECLNQMIFEKASTVDISCYENIGFYNNYTRAAAQAENRVVQVVNNFTEFFSLIISFIVYLTSTLYIDALAIFFSILPFFLLFGVTKRLNEERYQKETASVLFERKRAYVNRVVFLPDFAKEMRLTNVFSILESNLEDATKDLIDTNKKYGYKIALLRFLQDSISSIFLPFVRYSYVVIRMMAFKGISIGDFVLLIRSIGGLTHIIKHLSLSINKLYENSMYVDLFKKFIDYKPIISEDPNGIKPEGENYLIEFRNVSFRYNEDQRYILKNINMKIQPGERIAIVGKNGAGKSTFVKLLLRLYDVMEGEILLNGKNIKEYSIKEYRNLFGTLFQDYKIFALSVAENIKLDYCSEEDDEVIWNALASLGLDKKIEGYEKKLNSIVTKEFDDDGIVLSGGQTQRLAMARLFVRNLPIAVLDEPSSAVDPIAENEILNKLMVFCRNKSTIYISHKLSTVVSAHRIYLFDDGKIIEEGNHDELMKQRGLYYYMFKKQSENYIQ